jgi:catechol 2,3-dioxygenase-like lactoylglutathione lyase family enzyme
MLVPELGVTDIAVSRPFYLEVLGFSVMWERPEEGFVYLTREGAELMLDAITPHTAERGFAIAPLEPPLGRGMNLQIQVSDVAALYAAVQRAGARIPLALEEKSYRTGGFESGQRQFIVADPDGYLLRFYEDLGSRY